MLMIGWALPRYHELYRPVRVAYAAVIGDPKPGWPHIPDALVDTRRMLYHPLTPDFRALMLASRGSEFAGEECGSPEVSVEWTPSDTMRFVALSAYQNHRPSTNSARWSNNQQISAHENVTTKFCNAKSWSWRGDPRSHCQANSVKAIARRSCIVMREFGGGPFL
jgi:hypothetical protein